MTGVNEIRRTFLDYFGRNDHEIVASSPLVPHNDPTLMFANSGMVQFKNVFTGLETRSYQRATTAQKCVRAGGKHNDLDNVGYTARHHTFFEMLGNFSFGDYFKDHAIELAWSLITKEFGLNPDRLLVTVYSEDEEALGLWKAIAGLPDEKILRIPTSDNFWSMGETGPCGPCSEIFFDHGDHIPGGPPGSPDEDGDRFIEIWNLVFMQFEQVSPDERLALPRPSIDTGMGLERIAAVLQGTHDNYRTDLFGSLIEASVEATGRPADGDASASHRVIADHLRASAFLVADGVLPSNEGRGYVVRRIMRRAMRHAELLGANEPLMHRLVPTLVREMGAAYPELVRAEALIRDTLENEEVRFRQTLSRGLALLLSESEHLGPGDTLSGETAFRLYDTYGFPLDLTEDALRARGVAVDHAGFQTAMAHQRAEARKAWAGSGEAADEAAWFELREAHGATEFLGYHALSSEGQLLAIVKDGAPVETIYAGETAALILNQTPFYAESGGQQGDTGVIRAAAGAALGRVTDTVKRAGSSHVHEITVETGTMTVGDSLELFVDHERREHLKGNHSATHLLHESLRRVLGDHVAQKGSLVAPDRLRFDFSHPKPIDMEDLARVEDMANAVVQQNVPVETRVMDIKDAMSRGAMALFGEKYGDEVRVVEMGSPDATAPDKPFSLELCGGTHVTRTGDIGPIAILSDAAVSSGVRRIEALSGESARSYLRTQDQRLRDLATLLKVPSDQIETRISQVIEERRKLERDVESLRTKLAMGGAGSPNVTSNESIAGVPFLSRIVDGVQPKALRSIVDQMKTTLGSGVVAIVARSDGDKAALVVGVTSDRAHDISAVDLIKPGAEALGGRGGGGRPDLAQAGGPDADQAEAALAAVRDQLEVVARAAVRSAT
ncbi:MAG: alanine--tRNA ligase [Pseudomonadota bacterium]